MEVDAHFMGSLTVGFSRKAGEFYPLKALPRLATYISETLLELEPHIKVEP